MSENKKGDRVPNLAARVDKKKESIIGEGSSIKTRLFYLLFAGIMAVVIEWFALRHLNGLGFSIAVWFYMIGIVGLLIVTKRAKQPFFWFLLIPLFVLSIDTLIYTNELIVQFVPIFVAVHLLFMTALVTLQNPKKFKFYFSAYPLFQNIDDFFGKQLMQVLKDPFYFKVRGSDQWKKVAIGVLVAIPFLLVFGALFAQADEVFKQFFSEFITVYIDAEFIFRVVRMFIIAVAFGGLLYTFIGEGHVMQKTEKKPLPFDHTITVTVLFLLNLLFATFVVIQFRYFFGGTEFIFDNGITFAEYARGGFFELVWVLILTGTLITVVYRAFHNRFTWWLRGLQVALIAQVSVVAFSALARMNVYQDTFGFTVLRLYVEWFIYLALIFSALGIIGILAKIAFRHVWHIGLGLGIIAFSVVASMNVDKIIAIENINLANRTGTELDWRYLANDLSYDAAEQVLSIEVEYTVDDTFKINDDSYAYRRYPKYNLIKSTKRYKKEFREYLDEYNNSWLDYHYGRSQMQKLVE